MGVLNNPKRESIAREPEKKKRRAVAADFLGRLKPFDKWVAERNPSEFEKEIYWMIAGRNHRARS